MKTHTQTNLVSKAVIVFLCGGLAMTSLSSCNKSGNEALAKVGQTSITDADLDILVRANPRLKPRLDSPVGKQKIVENYVEQEILYQESMRRGLGKSEAVRDRMKLYDKIIVAQALLDDELDKKVREYYDNHKDEFERVKISHIFVSTTSPAPEKEQPKEVKETKNKKVAPKAPAGRSEADALKLAEEIRGKLNKGEDFEKLVSTYSDDDKTKGAAGDLGYVTIHDKRLERWGWLPLAEKAFAMKTGEISDVIKTADGFHIVKVTEAKTTQPLEEADMSIRFRIQADVRAQLMDELKKKYKVEFAKSMAPGAEVPETVPLPPMAPTGSTGGTGEK